MDYESSTTEEIETLSKKAEKIFNDPDNHCLDEMENVLKEIDELIDSYHKTKHGENVIWLKGR